MIHRETLWRSMPGEPTSLAASLGCAGGRMLIVGVIKLLLVGLLVLFHRDLSLGSKISARMMPAGESEHSELLMNGC
jgi:hypothetical protein